VPSLALAGVDVVNTVDGSVARNMTVVVDGARIARVVPSTPDAQFAAGTRVVRLSGKYVIPGLWDMHVHSFLDERDPDWLFPLLIAHGVTGIRDMGSMVPIVKMRRLREEVARGRRVGPRVVVAGPLLDGLNTVWKEPGGVPSPEEAREAVKLLREQGADFIKVYPLLSREAYGAVVAEANRLGLPVAGQVPETVAAQAASNAGQRSFEHLEKVILGCSSAESEVLEQRRHALQEGSTLEERLEGLATSPEETERMIEGFDLPRCKELIATLAKNRTAVVPTLVGFQAYLPRTRQRDDPRLQQIPPVVREAWALMDAQLALMPESRVDVAAAVGYLSVRMVRPLKRGGVPILAGTHTAPITPFVFPGSGLHDEMVLLEAAGLTALEALQAATLAPARYFRDEAHHGTVAAGRVADLLVLDANPLEEVRNVRRVHAVVANGRLFDRGALDKLLLDAAASRR
jgi:imidazolonepropionase-like amidohydrolase